MENKNQTQNNIDIHQLLVQSYGEGKAPEDVNLRLLNRLQYEEQTKERGISFWWLPAVVNTSVMLGIAIICIVLYVVVNYISSDWIMPNLTHIISKMWLCIVCTVAFAQVLLSWIFTLFSLWKLNLKNKCRIF